MTRDEVIKHLTDIKEYMVAGNPIWDVELVKKVFDIAIYTMGSISKLKAERDAALQCTCCEYRVGSLCCYSDVPDVEQRKMGEWDMFELITSVWYGKQCYFKEDYGMAYSRISHKTMPIQEAINEFMGEISQS